MEKEGEKERDVSYVEVLTFKVAIMKVGAMYGQRQFCLRSAMGGEKQHRCESKQESQIQRYC